MDLRTQKAAGNPSLQGPVRTDAELEKQQESGQARMELRTQKAAGNPSLQGPGRTDVELE